MKIDNSHKYLKIKFFVAQIVSAILIFFAKTSVTQKNIKNVKFEFDMTNL